MVSPSSSLGLPNDLAVHFLDLFSDQSQNSLARPRKGVVLTRSRTSVLARRAFEPTMPFHSLQQGIKSPRADLVAMTTQFAHHPLPVDRTLGCVMQNVDFPEAKKDLTSYSIDSYSHTTVIVDGYRSKVNPVFGPHISSSTAVRPA
jgi:hypothetical protein